LDFAAIISLDVTGMRHEIPVCADFAAKAIAMAEWQTARRDDYNES
jgi:hypothetical protein